jgi:hypothetical protein
VKERHYYVFTMRESSPIPFYERTMSTLAGTLRWIGRSRHVAFFTIDCLPKRYWY